MLGRGLKSFCVKIDKNKISSAHLYIEKRSQPLWAHNFHLRYFPEKVRDWTRAIIYFQYELNKILLNNTKISLALGKLDYWKESISGIYEVNSEERDS